MTEVDEPTFADLLCLLDRWRHFAYYQLEPRADVLFALFLPEALKACRRIAVDPRIIPQFPIKKCNSRQADRVDYFAMSEDGKVGYLIELKTDMSSIRPSQESYLGKALEKGIHGILRDLKEIAKVKDKRARQKYIHMLAALSELGLVELPPELIKKAYAPVSRDMEELISRICLPRCLNLKIVHIQPERTKDDKCEDDFLYIYFDEFADAVQKSGKAGELFAGYLRKWKERAAKCRPLMCE